MKYLIVYSAGKFIANRIVKEESIQGAIQRHEDEYGLDNNPIINVFELTDDFTTEIYDDEE